ncbi:MAG TPA: hypothetical protein VLS96_05525 [Nodosilinea sp.]|nr:hypothetical protein [Nodosilinea sp.]
MAGLLQSSVGLLRSRLSRQIVAWVFLSLALIEAIIFVPSYQRRQQAQLRTLEQVSEELLFTVKVSAMTSQDIEAVFSLVQAQLMPNSVVQGAALYKPDGSLLRQFGEPPEIAVADLGPREIRR